jgi:hypothetical protein
MSAAEHALAPGLGEAVPGEEAFGLAVAPESTRAGRPLAPVLRDVPAPEV